MRAPRFAGEHVSFAPRARVVHTPSELMARDFGKASGALPAAVSKNVVPSETVLVYSLIMVLGRTEADPARPRQIEQSWPPPACKSAAVRVKQEAP